MGDNNYFGSGCLLSEKLHGCNSIGTIRWRNPGYGKKLGEEFITEGLATLFEEELTNKTPPYAKLKLNPKQVDKAKRLINSTTFDHNEWFYGSKQIDNWFGYSYGYQLCKAYSEKTGKTAAQLVDASASRILDQ